MLFTDVLNLQLTTRNNAKYLYIVYIPNVLLPCGSNGL